MSKQHARTLTYLLTYCEITHRLALLIN